MSVLNDLYWTKTQQAMVAKKIHGCVPSEAQPSSNQKTIFYKKSIFLQSVLTVKSDTAHVCPSHGQGVVRNCFKSCVPMRIVALFTLSRPSSTLLHHALLRSVGGKRCG